MKKIKKFSSEKGITIIEAVVASFIVSIGFISIYNLSSVITENSINSIEREKASMLMVGMMEDLEANVSNIATSNYSGGTATDLNSKCSITPSAKHEKHLRRWCQSLDGGLKSKKPNDVRNIYVRTVTKNNRKMKIITFQDIIFF